MENIFSFYTYLITFLQAIMLNLSPMPRVSLSPLGGREGEKLLYVTQSNVIHQAPISVYRSSGNIIFQQGCLA